ncbi:MAG: hypothetical protein PGN25_08825 [Methylorubrum populi]
MHLRSAVLHKDIPTHYANLMMQYMVARSLQSRIPYLQLSNFDLPYWNISHPEIPQSESDKACILWSEQHVDFERIAYLADTGIFSRFNWRGYGERIEYFPPKDVCRKLFVRFDIQTRSLGDDVLLCPVRGAEILDAIHPGYTVVPVDFYADIVEETGLIPVFIGQLGDNPYTRALRDRFPKADFIPHQDALIDFQTIRSAANIVVPVSTFGWLAAWLSHARTIILPVFGIFDPKPFPLHDLLPLSDPAYRFYAFPPQAAVPLSALLEAHGEIRGQWRRVAPSDLARP